ncbi:hypothetical protein GFS24_03670 [Chitinophaga sp. SYP-B3965]|uniref:hypothetical protein n=1 Tax=Chitinophaga sp. SYP-B3965 TaxID=2663120 RepID=UPI001299C1E1|nr:hypothetical protein [Chitinophaga sp. SYP-B3965]MRG44195.1 hypothetical protein [Chitinophaga sp. SYP-B3965]
MKSLEEILEMLVKELNESIPRIKNLKGDLVYYNEIMGTTSAFLVAVLGLHLEGKYEDWHSGKWMDDCLITKVILHEDRLVISAVAIWGVETDTSQWTEPLYFVIGLTERMTDGSNYTFLFGDENVDEIPYVDFRDDRTFWDGLERDWKYTITVRSGQYE